MKTYDIEVNVKYLFHVTAENYEHAQREAENYPEYYADSETEEIIIVERIEQ